MSFKSYCAHTQTHTWPIARPGPLRCSIINENYYCVMWLTYADKVLKSCHFSVHIRIATVSVSTIMIHSNRFGPQWRLSNPKRGNRAGEDDRDRRRLGLGISERLHRRTPHFLVTCPVPSSLGSRLNRVKKTNEFRRTDGQTDRETDRQTDNPGQSWSTGNGDGRLSHDDRKQLGDFSQRFFSHNSAVRDNEELW